MFSILRLLRLRRRTRCDPGGPGNLGDELMKRINPDTGYIEQIERQGPYGSLNPLGEPDRSSIIIEWDAID